MPFWTEMLSLSLNDSIVLFCFNNNLYWLGQFVLMDPTIQILTLNQVVLNSILAKYTKTERVINVY